MIRPMKAIIDSDFIRVFKYIHDHLITKGIKPAYMILLNEASPTFQIELNSKDINFQLVPPVIHCHNAA